MRLRQASAEVGRKNPSGPRKRANSASEKVKVVTVTKVDKFEVEQWQRRDKTFFFKFASRISYYTKIRKKHVNKLKIVYGMYYNSAFRFNGVCNSYMFDLLLKTLSSAIWIPFNSQNMKASSIKCEYNAKNYVNSSSKISWVIWSKRKWKICLKGGDRCFPTLIFTNNVKFSWSYKN